MAASISFKNNKDRFYLVFPCDQTTVAKWFRFKDSGGFKKDKEFLTKLLDVYESVNSMTFDDSRVYDIIDLPNDIKTLFDDKQAVVLEDQMNKQLPPEFQKRLFPDPNSTVNIRPIPNTPEPKTTNHDTPEHLIVKREPIAIGDEYEPNVDMSEYCQVKMEEEAAQMGGVVLGLAQPKSPVMATRLSQRKMIARTKPLPRVIVKKRRLKTSSDICNAFFLPNPDLELNRNASRKTYVKKSKSGRSERVLIVSTKVSAETGRAAGEVETNQETLAKNDQNQKADDANPRPPTPTDTSDNDVTFLDKIPIKPSSFARHFGLRSRTSARHANCRQMDSLYKIAIPTPPDNWISTAGSKKSPRKGKGAKPKNGELFTKDDQTKTVECLHCEAVMSFMESNAIYQITRHFLNAHSEPLPNIICQLKKLGLDAESIKRMKPKRAGTVGDGGAETSVN